MVGTFEDSTILDHDQNQAQTLRNVLGFPDGGERLLYRGSRDGWLSSNFHKHCDNKGPTVTLIKVVTTGAKYIFGGYIDQSWDCRGSYKTSKASFLFSLVNAMDLPPQKLPLIHGQEDHAIYCARDHGPTFGYGIIEKDEIVHDLKIFNRGNEFHCSTYLGQCYHGPQPPNPMGFLAGGQNSRVSEIEVYEMKK